MSLRPHRTSWILDHSWAIRLFSLVVFALGPGLGVALAVHLHAHDGPHHDSESCHICVQLTTNAKSPTIQLTSLPTMTDGPVEAAPVLVQQVHSSRGFSAASPRAPPLA